MINTVSASTNSENINKKPFGNLLLKEVASISFLNPIWCATFHPNSDKTLLITQNNGASIYSSDGSTEDGNLKFVEIESLQAHSRTVRRGQWSYPHKGNKIALCSFDGTVSVWDRTDSDSAALSYELTNCLEGCENEVKSVKWSNSGEYIATCARDRSVWIWISEDDVEYEILAVCNGHTQDVKDVMWHKTEPIVISCSYDDTIRTWMEKLDDWFCCNILRDHKDTVWSMDQNHDGSLMVSVSNDLSIIIWKFIKYTDQKQIEEEDRPFTYIPLKRIENAHERPIYSVSWSPDNRYIATVGGDNSIRIWGTKLNQPITEELIQDDQLVLISEVVHAHDSDINWIEFYSKDSRTLVTASDDEKVKLWRLEEVEVKSI